MLLSRPLFSGNPQLQQQIRKQIPRFLQQVSSLPSLLNTSMLWLHRNIGAKCIHHLHDNHSFVQHTTFFLCGHWIQVISVHSNTCLYCLWWISSFLMVSADAESRGAVSHAEPQSQWGSAADSTGPANSCCRGPCPDTYVSINTESTPHLKITHKMVLF